jgi:hypothetical protein
MLVFLTYKYKYVISLRYFSPLRRVQEVLVPRDFIGNL